MHILSASLISDHHQASSVPNPNSSLSLIHTSQGSPGNCPKAQFDCVTRHRGGVLQVAFPRFQIKSKQCGYLKPFVIHINLATSPASFFATAHQHSLPRKSAMTPSLD